MLEIPTRLNNKQQRSDWVCVHTERACMPPCIGYVLLRAVCVGLCADVFGVYTVTVSVRTYISRHLVCTIREKMVKLFAELLCQMLFCSLLALLVDGKQFSFCGYWVSAVNDHFPSSATVCRIFLPFAPTAPLTMPTMCAYFFLLREIKFVGIHWMPHARLWLSHSRMMNLSLLLANIYDGGSREFRNRPTSRESLDRSVWSSVFRSRTIDELMYVSKSVIFPRKPSATITRFKCAWINEM